MSREKGKVLVIDDSMVIQRLVDARLRPDGYQVMSCSRGKDGVEKAKSWRPDVILLDIEMPELNGYETLKLLKSDSACNMVPVIFITAQAKTEDKVRGLDMGAVDYVAKPFDPVELRARVRSAHNTKHLMDLLATKAQIDGLTGLKNRAYFNSRIVEELDRGKRYSAMVGMILLDVDKFKSINDTYGHSCGDYVLVEVAETLRTTARASDAVTRYGGEEFIVILPEQGLDKSIQAAERIRQAIADLRLVYNQVAVPVTASFGVASTEQLGYDSVHEMVECADRSLYAAKQNGRNRVCAWDGREPVSLAFAAV